MKSNEQSANYETSKFKSLKTGNTKFTPGINEFALDHSNEDTSLDTLQQRIKRKVSDAFAKKNAHNTSPSKQTVKQLSSPSNSKQTEPTTHTFNTNHRDPQTGIPSEKFFNTKMGKISSLSKTFKNDVEQKNKYTASKSTLETFANYVSDKTLQNNLASSTSKNKSFRKYNKSFRKYKIAFFATFLFAILLLLSTLYFGNGPYAHQKNLTEPLHSTLGNSNDQPLSQWRKFQPKLEIFLVSLYSNLASLAKSMGIPLETNLPPLQELPQIINPFTNKTANPQNGSTSIKENRESSHSIFLPQTEPSTKINNLQTHTFQKEFSLATFTPHIASPLLLNVQGKAVLFQVATSGAVYSINPIEGTIVNTTQLQSTVYAQPKILPLEKNIASLLVLHSPASFHLLETSNTLLLKSLNIAFSKNSEPLTKKTLNSISGENSLNFHEEIVASPLVLPSETELPSFIVATMEGRVLAFNKIYGKRLWSAIPALQQNTNKEISLQNYDELSLSGSTAGEVAGFFTSPIFVEHKSNSKAGGLKKFLQKKTFEKLLVVADLNGNVHALHATSGELKWRTNIGGTIKSPLLHGNFLSKKQKHIAIIDENGAASLIDENGKIILQQSSTMLQKEHTFKNQRMHVVSATILKKWDDQVDAIVFATQNGMVVRVHFSENTTHFTTLFNHHNASFIAQPQVLRFKRNTKLLLVDRNHGLLLLNPLHPELHAITSLKYPVTATPAISELSDDNSFNIYVAGENGIIENYLLYPTSSIAKN